MNTVCIDIMLSKVRSTVFVHIYIYIYIVYIYIDIMHSKLRLTVFVHMYRYTLGKLRLGVTCTADSVCSDMDKWWTRYRYNRSNFGSLNDLLCTKRKGITWVLDIISWFGRLPYFGHQKLQDQYLLYCDLPVRPGFLGWTQGASTVFSAMVRSCSLEASENAWHCCDMIGPQGIQKAGP